MQRKVELDDAGELEGSKISVGCKRVIKTETFLRRATLTFFASNASQFARVNNQILWIVFVFNKQSILVSGLNKLKKRNQ